MSKIECKQVTFGFDLQGKNLFEQVSLVIDDTWKLGLIGRNGRGKTTFLQLLLGTYPYQGKIIHQKHFHYFPQPIETPTRQVSEILAESGEFERWEIEKEFYELGLAPALLERPFAELSGGEQTKVRLAALFLNQNDFLLIDEPTNHLDQAGRALVAEYLRKKRQGFIVVSHDRAFVDAVVDHILSLEKQQVTLIQGDFTRYEAQKQRTDAAEAARQTKLQSEISRLKETAAQKSVWSAGREKEKHGDPRKKGSGAINDKGFIGARAARTMNRAKSLEARAAREISEKEQLLKNLEYVDSLSIKMLPSHHRILLETEALELAYEQPLFAPLTFQLKRGEQRAILGANGAGKSSLLKALLGDFSGTIKGTIARSASVKISWIRQDFEKNHGTLREFARVHQLDYQEFLNNLHKLGVERRVFAQRIESMSMGQRKRVEVAKSLSTPAELYIWDEPLNYLDVFNIEQLETLIATQKPTLLLVEHDQAFIQNIHARTTVLERADSV